MAKRAWSKSLTRPTRVPLPRKVVVASLSFALAAAATGALYSVPQLQELRQSRSDLQEAYEQSDALESRIRAASRGDSDGGDAQLQQLYQALQILEEALPATPSREAFTVSVVQMAEGVGVQVQRMDPDEGQSGSGRYRFNARFVGTYSALLTFLERLENMGQLVTLSSAQLTAQGDMYQMTAKLTLWYSPRERLTEPAPMVAPEPLPGLDGQPEVQDPASGEDDGVEDDAEDVAGDDVAGEDGAGEDVADSVEEAAGAGSND